LIHFQWEEDEDENTTRVMKPFFGKPECFLKETEFDEPWLLVPVGEY
jgi:hypothetical protein